MVTAAAARRRAPYGHHKEYFSSGFEGILIIAAALGILWGALDRWRHPQPLESVGLGVALAVVSSAINGALAFAMMRRGARCAPSRWRPTRATCSPTFDFSRRGGRPDRCAGHRLVVAGPAARRPGGAQHPARGRAPDARVHPRLMDEALDPRPSPASNACWRPSAPSSPCALDHIVSRVAGQRHFVDLHMHLPADWTLRQAAELRSAVERGLMQAVPGCAPPSNCCPPTSKPL